MQNKEIDAMSDDNVLAVQGEQTLERATRFDIPADGDGRTLYARIVPYNTPTVVSDAPHYIEYQEAFRADAFDAQLKAAGTAGERPVFLNFEHEPGLRGIIGRAVQLMSRSDGLYGEFRILDGVDGDKALALIRDKVLSGMSLEANASRSEMKNGVVWRTVARIKNAALTRTGIQAYPGAQVLAVRTNESEPDPPPEGDPPTDPDVASETLERLGVEPLHRGAVVTRPWDDSVARFTDDEYQRSCLVERAGEWLLPILEPNGDLNVNAMREAATKLSRSSMDIELKAKAARRLVRYYRMAGEEAPAYLKATASR